MKHFIKMLKASLLLLLITPKFLIASEELPPKLQVALMNKIMGLEKNLASRETISIYILDSPEVAKLLTAEVGKKMGRSVLEKVDVGDSVPERKYDVIYYGNALREDAAIKYAESNNSLSLYPNIDGMKNLGTLGLGIKSGKPTFLLNLMQSKAEELDWNPAILKVAATK